MLEQSKINTVGLIPARWASTRFEGKPLAMICGQTMIQRVYDRALMSKRLDEVYVVTDDDRIENYCNDNDLNVIRIDNVVPTGTDRIALTLDTLDADIYVNIQGDEPLIDPDAIDKLIESYTLGSVSNAYVKIEQDYKNSDINVVKVSFNKDNYATHFSRLPISPYQQMGLYAFSRDMLSMFSTLTRGEFEKRENVEMFRYIENGHKVKMVKVNDIGLSVDTPNDIKLVEEYLNGRD